ncbi:MAG: protein-L-isoaspartate(D-aspartate) O-methyltransferase [Deltaproteobacteria bacterium]|nr:protein-L-isoaspartate(D-aspartate) O-methyltransferase [Deltaproteobacteria bacterium]MBI3753045.1 protein-L-isoaspartate(D-aspartate) O-methyltransferase [Deltaproteobacteria bacterium]
MPPLKLKEKDNYARSRQRMVETQLIPRGIKDGRVLEAMRTIPRHLFVPEEALWSQAYSDFPLPIGEKQTISQPYIVAVMTEAMELKGTEKVLEIGTGSGYQAAVLSMLAYKVYSIERLSQLAARARKVLDSIGCSNVVVRIGDGTLGWQEEAPFDAILTTAAAPDIPRCYIEQLKIGGRLVIPVGEEYSQTLAKVIKTNKGIIRQDMGGCRFVKLVGRYGWKIEES